MACQLGPGPIIEYELNEQDVAQILAEQQADEDDADLFDDPSIYNLDIVAYLLLHRLRRRSGSPSIWPQGGVR